MPEGSPRAAANRGGRPTKLNALCVGRIVDAIQLGATYALAAQYGRISDDTLRRWMERGKKEKSGELHDFYAAVMAAQGEGAIGLLAKIEKSANEGQWQAAAWKLERRFPEMYGRTVQTHQGTLEAPAVQVSHTAEAKAPFDFDAFNSGLANFLGLPDPNAPAPAPDGGGGGGTPEEHGY